MPQGIPSLEIGTVIRSYQLETDPPKVKYWIVVGLSSDGVSLASVYINSRVHPFIVRNPDLLNAQYLLEPDSRELVEYPCYADCSQIKIKNLADIEALLAKKPQYIMGELYPEEVDAVMKLLRNCPNISEREKLVFGFR